MRCWGGPGSRISARHPDGQSMAASRSCLGGAGKPGAAWSPKEPNCPVAGGKPSPFPGHARGVQPDTLLWHSQRNRRISHPPRGRSVRRGVQGSGGSAELPQPPRRLGVCIFTGVPESVILLRAERLIQLSCYMANPASRSVHYPIAGGGSRAPPGTGVTAGVSGPFTLPAGSPGAPTASPAPLPLGSEPPENLGIVYRPGNRARLCGLL